MSQPLPPDDVLGRRPAGLTAAPARTGRLPLSEETLTSALELVTALALETIPSSTGSGVTVLRDGAGRSAAATSPLVEQADALQPAPD